VEIADNCADEPCKNGAKCTDLKNDFSCACTDGFSGKTCSDSEVILETDVNSNGAQASTSNAVGGTALAGIIIGVLAGLVLIVLILLVVVRRRQTKPKADAESASAVNPAFVNYESVNYGTNQEGFNPGLSNPLYSWYQPGMSRQECDQYLMNQGEGAFVIRDSAATPGWHLLAVKTRNSIIHDKIKMENGTYELLPYHCADKQPQFNAMPELVEHYARQNEGVPYSLAFNNPLYDSHLLRNTAVSWEYDPEAPAVPLKEREKTSVAQLTEAEGQEVYTNTEEAKRVLASSA
jgi:hypothetical protein